MTIQQLRAAMKAVVKRSNATTTKSGRESRNGAAATKTTSGRDSRKGSNKKTENAKPQRGTIQPTPPQDDMEDEEPSSMLLPFLWTYGPYGISVTVVWRGIWELQEMYLSPFPDHEIASALASIAIALACSVLLLAFPKALRRNETLATILMIVVTIFYFRGIWELWGELVFPDDPLLQNFAGLIPGSFLLWSSGALQSSLVGPPVLMFADSEEEYTAHLPLIELLSPSWSANASTLKED